jgi:arylsulfatase A-like enzyme
MNIIVISIDSLRYDYLGCYGNQKVKTPNIDNLAENGIIFREAIAQAPHTLTSHSSMLSGLYPFKHGLRKVQDLINPDNPDATMVFSQLKKNGYKIFSLLGMGIETFTFKMNSEWQELNYSGYSTLKNVHQLIRENHKQPFFLFLHYWDVHTPYLCYLPVGSRKEFLIDLAVFLESRGVSAKWIDDILLKYWHHRVDRIRDMMLTGGKYVEMVKAGYRRAVNKMDRYIGEVVSYLKTYGIFEDTLIVFTADHGDSFNEHNERQETDLYEHGCYLYDYLIHVPLILHYPHGISPADIASQVESVDIVPTIYDLTGITPVNDDDLDGASLLDIGQYPKEFAYSETEESDWCCVRNHRYKLMKHLRSETDKQLYDLKNDPLERENLYQKKVTVANKMEGYLEYLFEDYPKYTDPQPITAENEEELKEIENRLKNLGYL